LKFSKSTWILLVLGVAVIGAILVGMVRSQQTQQQQDLEKKLTEAQQMLAQIKVEDLVTKKDQLTQEKALFTAQVADAKAKLTAPIDNISATDEILKSAHEFDIRIANINSNGKSNNTMAGNKFSTLSFSIQVEGSIDSVAGFVSNLKTLFPTCVIDTYQLNISTPTPTPTSTPEDTPEVSSTPALTSSLPTNTAANINIVIYDYKGDANVE
jgi:hypothetical protein